MPTFNRKRIESVRLTKQPEKRSYKVDGYAKRSWRDYSYELRAKSLQCAIDGRFFKVEDLVTDHIIPVNEGGSFWDVRNHQVICKWHHNHKTGKENKTGVQTPWELNEDGEKIPKQ